MARPALSTIAACFCITACTHAADEAQTRAQTLVREAAALAEQKQYDGALDRLREAQEVAPDYAPAQSWLAHVYELMGEKEQALTHLAALLALEPGDEYGRASIRRLFYEPPFPRRVNPAMLAVSPVKFTVDRCMLSDHRVPGLPDHLALAYTTSPKYPEGAGEGGAVLERALPVATPNAPPARFNRVVHGYLEAPGTGDLELRVIAYYPSQLLSGHDSDLAPIAQSLVHLMLRIECYAGAYLGLPLQGDAEGINRLWLCQGGEPGAERLDTDIFLYRAFEEARTPMEWVRQLAHECGHLLIPAIGGFAQPEVWGNGELGERLFTHFLTQEAAQVANAEWPSAQAAARLNDLWVGEHIAAEEYLASAGRMPLNLWAGEGPESDLIVGQDERSMQYYVGFALHLLAAHGPGGLREVIKTCRGTTVPDFVYTYKQVASVWAADGPLSFGPGCYDASTTRLTSPPAASLSPEAVVLARGDTVSYHLFLPTGQWRLSLPLGSTDRTLGKLLVSFDGSPEVEVAVGPEAKSAPIGPLTEGWHRLTLRAPAEQPPLSLARLIFDQGVAA